MKKIILIGRSECGKTTLTQALKGEKIHYHKTVNIVHSRFLIKQGVMYMVLYRKKRL